MSAFEIRHGDALAILREMPDESVNCCVTSPPYYGLRDYGCTGQIGLEKTPELFIARLVEVFREVRRVLRADGTLWVNIGDSYAGSSVIGRNDAGRNFTGGGGNKEGSGNPGRMGFRPGNPEKNKGSSNRDGLGPVSGCKPKDLIGVPWLLAFALRADGWYLRSEIIWHKPNPMPESVTDRPTKAHEQVFLFAKSQRYAYDAEAIKEAATDTGHINGRDGRDEESGARPPGSNPRTLARIDYSTRGRNKRTVWTLATLPTPDAHFATFPIELPETCILAGCPVGGLVIDPFAGAGTTGLAALKHGRRFIGIELNAEYIGIAHRRVNRHSPLLAEIPA